MYVSLVAVKLKIFIVCVGVHRWRYMFITYFIIYLYKNQKYVNEIFMRFELSVSCFAL